MSDEFSPMDDRMLFGRLRFSSPAPHPQSGAEPDAMMLAAWLEGRPDADCAAVEALLAADPSLLDDMLALGRTVVAESPSPGFLARAQALVPASASATTGKVVPFRPVPVSRAPSAPARRISPWLAWSAVAASVAFISVVGFNMGTLAEQKLYPASSTATAGDQHETILDFLDFPGTNDVIS